MEILLLSEVFLTTDILDSALEMLDISAKATITGSSNEVSYAMENKNLSILVIDTYIIESIPQGWIQSMIHIYKNTSFILVSYNSNEEDIFKWIDLGFANVVSSSLELAVAIKKEIRNITRAQENQELKESNQFLKLVLDHVPAGIFWKDRNSHYLGCNKLHANAMNFTSTEDIVGKRDSDFHYSEEKIKLFHEDDLRVIAYNRQLSRITTYKGANVEGKEIWTETNKVPIRNEVGNVIGIVGLYKDITDKIILEKQLIEQEERYRTIIENLSEGVIVYDSELNIINCNSSAEKITGYKLHELMDNLHLKNEKVRLNESGEVMHNEQLPHYVTRNTRAACFNVVIGFWQENAKIKWVRFNTVPIFKNKTEISMITTTLVDITEEKNSNDTIHIAQENLTNIFSNTHIGLVYLDTGFNYIQVNEAYAKACGYPSEYFKGKNHFALFPHEKNETIFNNVVKTCESYTVYADSFSFPDHPEWGITYWDWSLKPIKDTNGKLTALLFSVINVTDNIKSQNKIIETELLYTNIFSVMSESIVVLNKQRQLVVSNPSGQKLLNNTSEFINSSGYLQFVNDNLIEIQLEDYPSNITLRTGVPCKDQVIGIRVNAKDYLWILVNTQPILSPDSKEVIMVVISSVDITEKRRISQELMIKKKMEAIGNLASTIVHDFNNILQPVILFSGILKSELSKITQIDKIEKLVDYVDKIHAVSVHGKNMIREILKLAQKDTECTQTIDLVKTIKENLNELQIIKPTNIQIVFKTDLKIALVDASATNIHQIISNLCNNSMYAMKNKSIGVFTIEINKLEIAGKLRNILNNTSSQFAYEIIVLDEGKGIKKENLDRLFDPYFTTKQNDGGTGLGLHSVYSIVQNLNGNISVVSKEDIGTRFTIYLPCKESR